MPIILYGTRTYRLPTGSGGFFCPDCTEDREYRKVTAFAAVHIYFIPIIPYRFETYVECRECYGSFRPDVLEWDPRRDPGFPSASREAILDTMVLMMVADGDVDSREVETIRRVYEQLTTEPLSVEQVHAKVATYQQGASLLDALARVRLGLNKEGRERVLRASIMVALADGVVTDEESALVQSIARVLNIPSPRAMTIWEQTAASGVPALPRS